MRMQWFTRLTLRRRLARALGLPVIGSDVPQRTKARAFLKSKDGKRVHLSDFEKRFRITAVNDDRKIDGYSKSPYYQPEDPNRIKRNRKLTDKFLASKS
ncbi:MAG TPA: hypothetical protein VHS06_11920 [Chloroflexota bacterium]|nr:hypothetical protein [Chloroflexota bacterium]